MREPQAETSFGDYVRARERAQPGGRGLYIAWRLSIVAGAWAHFGLAIAALFALGALAGPVVVMYPFWRWRRRPREAGSHGGRE